MNIQALIECLEEHQISIGDATIHKMDFDKLEKDLDDATGALKSLAQKEALCEKLLTDFKSEVKKMALAISRAKGDMGSSGLVEKLLSSADLGFEDLLFLREKVKEELNHSFPSSPQSRVLGGIPESKFNASVFKTGANA
jgi:hypothetical protein